MFSLARTDGNHARDDNFKPLIQESKPVEIPWTSHCGACRALY